MLTRVRTNTTETLEVVEIINALLDSGGTAEVPILTRNGPADRWGKL